MENKSTKREIISKLRNKLREVSSDSIYTNKFLYSIICEHAKWLIKREWSQNKLFRNKSIFQRLPCLPTKLVDPLEGCSISGKAVYRTECKLPLMWQSELGPIIKRVASIDNYTEFKVISASEWATKLRSPYLSYTKEKYCILQDDYLFFPNSHPKRISIEGLIYGSTTDLCNCSEEKECVRFLDTPFSIPTWIEAEIIDKCVQQLLGQTSRVQNDENLNSNTNIRN